MRAWNACTEFALAPVLGLRHFLLFILSLWKSPMCSTCAFPTNRWHEELQPLLRQKLITWILTLILNRCMVRAGVNLIEALSLEKVQSSYVTVSCCRRRHTLKTVKKESPGHAVKTVKRKSRGDGQRHLASVFVDGRWAAGAKRLWWLLRMPLFTHRNICSGRHCYTC